MEADEEEDVVEVGWGSSPPVTSRVVVHVDLDCFFVQVEKLKDRSLEGKVVAVQQHNDIIAVDYEGRRRGLKKHMTPAEALAICPDLQLVHVRRSPGTSKVTYEDYQKASSEVHRLLRTTLDEFMTPAGAQGRVIEIEKASIDDFYIDLTPLVAMQVKQSHLASQAASQSEWPGHIQGVVSPIISSQDMQLREGAMIASALREAILTNCGLKASAGIATNKFIAKLASSASKPNGQTTVLSTAVPHMLSRCPPNKIPQLGVRLGKERRNLLLEGEWRDRVKVISDLAQVSREELTHAFGDKAEWLCNIGLGVDDEPVKDKGPPKSLMSSMSLTSIMNDTQQFKKILHYLADELCRRLYEDEATWRRRPSTFVFGFRLVNEKEISHSLKMKKITEQMSRIMPSDGKAQSPLPVTPLAESMCVSALQLFHSSVGDRAWKVRWAGMTARDFITTDEPKGSILKFFTSSTQAATPAGSRTSTQVSPKRQAPTEASAEQNSQTRQASPVKRARKSPVPRKGKNSTKEKQANTMLSYFTPKLNVTEID